MLTTMIEFSIQGLEFKDSDDTSIVDDKNSDIGKVEVVVIVVR